MLTAREREHRWIEKTFMKENEQETCDTQAQQDRHSPPTIPGGAREKLDTEKIADAGMNDDENGNDTAKNENDSDSDESYSSRPVPRQPDGSICVKIYCGGILFIDHAST